MTGTERARQQVAAMRGAGDVALAQRSPVRVIVEGVAVQRKHMGPFVPLKVGDEVAVGDVVRAGPHTVLKLYFVIGGAVSIRNTSATIIGERNQAHQRHHRRDAQV